MQTDATPTSGNPDEPVQELGEGQPAVGEPLPEVPSSQPSSGDPLDGIEDTNELRTYAVSLAASLGRDAIAELAGVTDADTIRGVAKKYRAISQRNPKRETVPAPTEPAPAATPAVPAQPTDALTRKDLHRMNSRQAMKQLAADANMAPHADAIREAYRNTRGQDDPDAIFEDLKDAFAIVKSRTTPAPQDAAAPLQTSPGVRPSGRPVAPTGRTTQPLIRPKQPITEWYPKPSKE